ncbi:MAG: nitroreductase/quinone reductase family protein [Chloroflexota bacterium]
MTTQSSVTERKFMPNYITAPLNALIGGLLRSPLHGALSSSTIVLSFRGRKSGKQYTFPVGYYDHQGDNLVVIPLHPWWKNLQGNVPVTVWLKGHKYAGTADASQGDEATVAALEKLIHDSANLMRVYHIERGANGEPNPEQIRQVAQSLALVRIRLQS